MTDHHSQQPLASYLALGGALLLTACQIGTEAAPIPDEEPGCTDAALYERPTDPAQVGPWDVGVRTVSIGRLSADVLYPATIGSAAGLPAVEVDIRYALPLSQQHLVTDEARPDQRCKGCARDLPLDQDHGPYPLVVFVHGTASWRMQSLSLMEHWASRGYVVIAADHPGLFLQDLLSSLCGEGSGPSQDLGEDINDLLAAFSQDDPALSFVSPWVDLERIAVLGHSAGASAAAGAASHPGVRVIGSLAGNRSVTADDGLQASLFMGGMADSVVRFDRTEEAYLSSAGPRHLLGIADAGHLIFSDICQITNAADQNLIEIATEAGVCGTEFASFLFDCSASVLPAEQGQALVRAATTWVLEKELHCKDQVQDFGDFGIPAQWIEVLATSP